MGWAAGEGVGRCWGCSRRLHWHSRSIAKPTTITHPNHPNHPHHPPTHPPTGRSTRPPDCLLQELDGLKVLLPQVVRLHQHEEALGLAGQPRLCSLHLTLLQAVGLHAALPAGARGGAGRDGGAGAGAGAAGMMQGIGPVPAIAAAGHAQPRHTANQTTRPSKTRSSRSHPPEEAAHLFVVAPRLCRQPVGGQVLHEVAVLPQLGRQRLQGPLLGGRGGRDVGLQEGRVGCGAGAAGRRGRVSGGGWGIAGGFWRQGAGANSANSLTPRQMTQR